MRTDGTEFPKGLVLAKPIGQESYKESVLHTLEQQGNLIIQQKHDGYKLIAIRGGDGRFRIWTVGGRPVHGRLGHVMKVLESRPFPWGTVLVGEGLMFEEDAERYEWTAKVFQGGDESGLSAQKEHGRAVFRIFQAFNLEDLSAGVAGRSYGETLAWLSETAGPRNRAVSVVPSLSMKLDDAKTVVAAQGWEGLVLTDARYRLTWRTDGGTEPRPKGCYKFKPLTEDDFVILPDGRIWHKDGRLKEVVLYQRDPGTGKLFSCGKLGTFSREVRDKLSSPSLAPSVMQVAFERRNPDTGKLRFARFMRLRDDKLAASCVAPASYPKSETV
ncbi:MAG TPA: hypothetical protein VD862_00620 [Candidatus Paceibacterota bacterium]|nr:hypothetical protein [Candidatus Paceibacterota bacterium]